MPEPLDRGRLVRALDAFGLGEPRAVRRLPVGAMNHNWRVDTDLGSYAVKQVLDVDPARSRRQHAAVEALADKGFPIPRPVRLPNGETVLELSGRHFSVVPWVEGVHRPGHELSLAECGEFGALLGELQLALGEVLPAAERRVPAASADPAATFELIETYLARIDGLAEPDEFDGYVRRRLPERGDLLRRWLSRRPADRPTGPAGWTHGDFHHHNVLWSGGAVSAVLDWDRLRIAPLARELVRSATFTFGCKDGRIPDLTRIATYARGYRSVVTMTDAEITDAADRRWWSNLTGLWPLDARYERGDTSCDRYFPEQCDLLAWWCDSREAMARALVGSG